ncbi:probable 18S rRNA (guanine-N(7))-methyltransferase [Pollicipes pollicipes]|uniref:probable 18S rRNA (guanine-N(7))-methyltransferase n=1 Tax=Pollicipes pollicipes TaxID=41117 RepID=UPI0018858254|nr:probable 18S rRNA (guanine-N(7))-methyltransferase [Pollicipes pollicipes]XP_037090951.1 probable 18S rRNA (guanine-N(7))-methyltransferase [Pollicipes pollicipes]XP_037092544.1 probable 18S rRNA (guanine-N(7))-methyltransferase [Pollicipes pollicipes]
MASSTRRPEHAAPPEIFYDEKEARKYSSNSRMIEVQERMTERALELLALPEGIPHLVLDLGCGSGLSGETITEAGHVWVGCDISQAMLNVSIEREVEGDVLLSDLGQGLPFRAGSFDGALSISALQWLCNADKKEHVPRKRLYKFFSSLYGCLGRGGRAVFQFYPESSAQVEMITAQAMKAGFTGGLVVDYPNSTKAKKMFLVLMSGGPQPLPEALGDGGQASAVAYAKRDRMRQLRGKPPKSSRDWVREKKERRRRQGKEVARDSKYTGRRRAAGF